MLIEHGVRSYRHRSHWFDLQEDIVDLFQEAQEQLLLSAAHQKRLFRALQKRCQSKKLGWHCKKPERGFYAKQAARYNTKFSCLVPAFNPDLYCYGCLYQAHTPSQFRMHMHMHRLSIEKKVHPFAEARMKKKRLEEERMRLEQQADALLQAAGF